MLEHVPGRPNPSGTRAAPVGRVYFGDAVGRRVMSGESGSGAAGLGKGQRRCARRPVRNKDENPLVEPGVPDGLQALSSFAAHFRNRRPLMPTTPHGPIYDKTPATDSNPLAPTGEVIPLSQRLALEVHAFKHWTMVVLLLDGHRWVDLPPAGRAPVASGSAIFRSGGDSRNRRHLVSRGMHAPYQRHDAPSATKPRAARLGRVQAKCSTVQRIGDRASAEAKANPSCRATLTRRARLPSPYEAHSIMLIKAKPK